MDQTIIIGEMEEGTIFDDFNKIKNKNKLINNKIKMKLKYHFKISNKL